MSSERFCANSGRTFGYISYAIKKLKNCNFWFLTCWLTKGQQVISSALFRFPVSSSAFFVRGYSECKISNSNEYSFYNPIQNPFWTSNQNSKPNFKPKPLPKFDQTSSELRPNFDLTSTELRPNFNRTECKIKTRGWSLNSKWTDQQV